MTREEQILNDPNLTPYVDKERGWINEAFMDGARWADEHPEWTKIAYLAHQFRERTTDWNQVRIQAAIAAMQGLLANPDKLNDIDSLTEKARIAPQVYIAAVSITQADALIKELKGK